VKLPCQYLTIIKERKKNGLDGRRNYEFINLQVLCTALGTVVLGLHGYSHAELRTTAPKGLIKGDAINLFFLHTVSLKILGGASVIS